MLRSVLDLGRGRWVWAGVILLALLPAIGGGTGLIGNYGFLQLSLMVVFAIAVLGLNLLTGFNGQISLGHGAFFAIGGYTTAVLMFHYGVPYWLTLPAAAAMCFVAGYLFAPVLIRALSPAFVRAAILLVSAASGVGLLIKGWSV